MSGLQPASFRTRTQIRAGHMQPMETAVDPMSRITQPNCHLVKIPLMQMSNLVLRHTFGADPNDCRGVTKRSRAIYNLGSFDGTSNIVANLNDDSSLSGCFEYRKNAGSKWSGSIGLSSKQATANTDTVHLAFGKDKQHNNLSPSLSAYTWQRTA